MAQDPRTLEIVISTHATIERLERIRRLIDRLADLIPDFVPASQQEEKEALIDDIVHEITGWITYDQREDK